MSIYRAIADKAHEQHYALRSVTLDDDTDHGHVAVSVVEPHITERFVQLRGIGRHAFANMHLLTSLGGGSLMGHTLYQVYLLAEAMQYDQGNRRQYDLFRPAPDLAQRPDYNFELAEQVVLPGGSAQGRLMVGQLSRDWMQIAGIDDNLGTRAAAVFNRHMSPSVYKVLQGFEQAYKRDLKLAGLA